MHRLLQIMPGAKKKKLLAKQHYYILLLRNREREDLLGVRGLFSYYTKASLMSGE